MGEVATKRRLRADDRRALIVEAALEQFAEHGYDAASMGEIARRAGVTRTVLYDHFESKRALYVELVEDKHAELLARQRVEISADAPLAERLGAAVDVFYGFAESEPLAWRLSTRSGDGRRITQASVRLASARRARSRSSPSSPEPAARA